MIRYFAQPIWLLAILAIIPAGFVFFLGYRRLNRLLPLLAGSGNGETRVSRTLIFRAICFALAWICLICAAASPRWGAGLVATRQQGSSVVFVMDVSRSMTVSDVSPDRLRFSARYASLIVDRMDKTPCGVVLVKGDAVLAIPLTDDRRSVLDLFDSLSPALVSSPGSGLASGIRVALAAFPDSIAASRTVILFTDGDETAGSLADAARKVGSVGAKLVIVGAGTSTGAELNVFPGSAEPRMQLTRLREDSLKAAARAAGNGSFYVNGLETGSALRILDAIAPAVGSDVQLVYSPKPVYRYAGFLVVALGFFCAGCVAGGLSWRKKD